MYIKSILFILVVLVVVVISEFLKKKITSNKENNEEEFLPYKKKPFLMTASEYNFFQVLDQAVNGRYYVVPQVAIADIVDVLDDYKKNKSYRSKIDKKTIDFVLFNKAGYTPYLALELDDSSHERFDRVVRDQFVEKVFNKVGIKLVRVKNAYSYDLEVLKKVLNL